MTIAYDPPDPNINTAPVWVGDDPPSQPDEGTIWVDTNAGSITWGSGTYVANNSIRTNMINSGSSGLVGSNQNIFYSAGMQTCPTCNAQVETCDVLTHSEWHEAQEKRLHLLESLLRDVLVNKIDIDTLLDL